MASVFQRLLGMGGRQVARRGSTATAELAEELAQEAPEVIGRGTSRVGKEVVEDIPEAAWREITPQAPSVSNWDALMRSAKENPKTAAALAALTGGTAINQFVGSDDEEPEVPFRPDEPGSESVLPDNYNALAQAEADKMDDTVKTEAPKESGLDFDALSKKFDEGMAGLPKDVEPEIDEFGAAQERADRNLLLAQLGKAASQIGAGIATVGAGREVKADVSGFEDLAKLADRPITQLSMKQKHDKAKAELGDEKAMRDPKSEISKLVSELAVKTGLIKPGQEISAMNLKNAGVNLGTLLSTVEAGKARKEAAALASQQKIEAKESQLNEKQRKFVQGLRKEATSGVFGKQYATYATGQRMSQALEEFAKNPSGYKDYATLMGGLKSLQGDESVVREAEVRLGMSATSLFDSLQNQLQKAATGRMLQPDQRKQMIDTIKILTDASKREYMKAVEPILEQARMEGVDPNLILTGSLMAPTQTTTSAAVETKVFKQQIPAGSTVTTKSGKKYKIGPDGQTGTLIQE